MTPELRHRILLLRMILEDDPMGIVAGEIPPGSPDISADLHDWSKYGEFLKEADGGRFGSVDLWSVNDYPSKQYLAIDLPGGSDEWLIIGQLLYEPIALKRKSDTLFIFPRDGEPNGINLGEFDNFFINKVFSAEYRNLIPEGDKDEWWYTLKKCGLA